MASHDKRTVVATRQGRLEGVEQVSHDLLGLGRDRSAAALVREVERGFAYGILERFQKATALSLEQIAEVIRVPQRTLSRRRGERLRPDESDRLLRASRVFGRALELFEGDQDRARRWFVASNRALGGQTPLAFVKTDVGTREVEQLIGRLEHGIPS